MLTNPRYADVMSFNVKVTKHGTIRYVRYDFLLVRYISFLSVLRCTGFEIFDFNKLCGRPPKYVTAPCKLTFDLMTLKVVSESRVTYATYLPIFVFLGLPVLDFGLSDHDVRDKRQTDVRRQTKASLNATPIRGGA